MATTGSTHALLGFLLSLQLVLYTSAYFHFRKEIPNGERIPHPCLQGQLWDGVGHQNAGGGGERNPFGKAFKNNGYFYDEALCMEDSDGDGMYNGEELGDPFCEWEPGKPTQDPKGHPGVCEPVGSARCQGKSPWLDCRGFVCNGIHERDVFHIDLKFNRTKVPATETNYYCQTFVLPEDKDYHIVADKPILYNRNVTHHMLLYGCPNENDPIVQRFRTPGPCGMLAQSACPHTIGGWTVGGVGDCFDDIDAGTRIGKTAFKRVILEIHWNNPFGSTDEEDESGMKLYLTPHLRKHDLGVATFGQAGLRIPPGMSRFEQTSNCSSDCTSKELQNETIYIVSAGMHMHYLGIAASLVLHRKNGERITLANDTHFRYDSPVDHNHSPAIEAKPGDEFEVRCVFNSSSEKKHVYYGDATADEMCYSYVTYYPKTNFNYCVDFGGTELCNVEDIPVVAGCNTSSDAYWLKLVHLNKTCDNTGKVCRQACKDLLTNDPDPCYVGDAKIYTEFILPYVETGDKVILASRSCDEEIYNDLTSNAPGIYSAQSTCFGVLMTTALYLLF